MKEFNVLWHLLNYCLVVWLGLKVFRIAGLSLQVAAALILGIVWVIHPVHVSTVFLTVQRMTLMMSTCILAGLLLYVHGREIVESRLLKGHAFMWGGLALGGFVGSLFKETAVGMPFYIIALELTLLAHIPRGEKRIWHLFVGVCLVMPLFLVIGYVLLDPHGGVSLNWAKRDYSPLEKILTEFRVLSEYVRQILVPDLSRFGIYQDSVKFSETLFSPITTFFSVAAWTILLAGSLMYRHRAPLVACGIFWFFGGHFLEAMVLPIELYFEHRNYLPSIGIFLALAGVSRFIPPEYGKHATVLVVVFVIIYLAMTYSNAKVWGNGHQLSETWYIEQPDSTRAMQQYVKSLNYRGRRREAVAILQEFVEKNRRKDITVAMTYLDRQCPDSFEEQWQELVRNARSAEFKNNISESVSSLINRDYCAKISMGHVRHLIRELMSNQNYTRSPRFRKILYLLYAYTYREEGNLSQAMYFSEQAYNINPTPMVPKMQALWLLEAGLDRLALEYVEKALATPEDTRIITLKGRPELESLREAIVYRIENEVH